MRSQPRPCIGWHGSEASVGAAPAAGRHPAGPPSCVACPPFLHASKACAQQVRRQLARAGARPHMPRLRMPAPSGAQSLARNVPPRPAAAAPHPAPHPTPRSIAEVLTTSLLHRAITYAKAYRGVDLWQLAQASPATAAPHEPPLLAASPDGVQPGLWQHARPTAAGTRASPTSPACTAACTPGKPAEAQAQDGVADATRAAHAVCAGTWADPHGGVDAGGAGAAVW